MSQWTDFVALITGANKGLGLEIARQLGKLGIRVVIGARDVSKANQAAEKLQSEGLDAHAIKLDVTDNSDITALPNYIRQKFGRLDILVNNAGINAESGAWRGSTAGSITAEVLRKTFDTNFFGAVAVTQALLSLIKESPAGRIVNHSSILGSLALQADPKSPIYDTKPFGYDASKSALNAFTVHLAAELKPTRVKVNSAHPGWVKTDLGTSAAPMETPEGAQTAVTLATLPDNGPTGAFFHNGNRLPW